jgi:hypothetical protein
MRPRTEENQVENGVTRLLASLKEHFNLYRCSVMVRPLGNTAPVRSKSAALSYRLLSSHEVQDYSADPELELGEGFVKAAAGRGDSCVGAFDGDKLVGYAWLAFAAAPYQESVWVTFDMRACYAYRAFVLPAWQGRDIERTLRVVADDLCIWSGKSFAISFIDARNRHSIAEAQRTGAQEVATAGYMETLGMNWVVRAPGADRFEFRFYKPGQDGVPAEQGAAAHASSA